MGMPNPSGIIREQTKAVEKQVDSKKFQMLSEIDSQTNEQLAGVKSQSEKQISQIEGKIAELRKIREQMSSDDPRLKDVNRQIGMLQGQIRQVKAQVRLAIASVKANAARAKENVRTNLERQKAQAIRGAVEQAMAQFSMLMAKKRMQEEGAVGDELRSGNRG